MVKTFLLAFLALIQLEYGQAAYYNPGVFKQVVAIRQAGWTANPLPKKLPKIIGFVARQNCNEIGQHLYICHHSEGCKGPYLIADCANKIEGHDKAMQRKNIIAEVDYNTAIRWKVTKLGPNSINVVVICTAQNAIQK